MVGSGRRSGARRDRWSQVLAGGAFVLRFARTPLGDDEDGARGRARQACDRFSLGAAPPSASLRSAPPPTAWGWRMGVSAGGGLSSTPRSGGGGGVAQRRRRGGAAVEDEGRRWSGAGGGAGLVVDRIAGMGGGAWNPDTSFFAALGRRSGMTKAGARRPPAPRPQRPHPKARAERASGGAMRDGDPDFTPAASSAPGARCGRSLRR
jgi:hypothetical protein